MKRSIYVGKLNLKSPCKHVRVENFVLLCADLNHILALSIMSRLSPQYYGLCLEETYAKNEL